MSAIEDIWDTPAEPSTPRKRSSPIVVDDDDDDDEATAGHNRPSKRQALFLADSDDEQPAAPTGPTRTSIDAMFELDDDGADDPSAYIGLGPGADDVDAILRAARAKYANAKEVPSLTPHAIMSSSPPPEGAGAGAGGAKGRGDDGERKARKKAARMDETRLVGPSGFPALIQSTKGFVPRGKGHEASDLNRLLQVYQFWTHKMYPKTQFRDTVNTVEKLCHSRRMQVSLSVWRDEAKGLVNGKKPEDPDDKAVVDLTSDVEPDSSPSRPKRKLLHPKSSSPLIDADMDMDTEQPTRPPSSSTEFDDDGFDMDAIMKEQEEESLQRLRAASGKAALAPKAQAVYADEDVDAMWAELDDIDVAPAASAPAPQPVPDDDDEMWDIMQDNEPEVAPWVPPAAPVLEDPIILPEPSVPDENTGRAEVGDGGADAREKSAAENRRPTNDEDWDDMYQ